PARMLGSRRRGRAEPLSEAMLDRPMGGTEALGADALGAAEPAAERASVDLEHAPGVHGEPTNPHRHRHRDEATALRNLPRGDLSPFQRAVRYWFSRMLATVAMKGWLNVSVVNPERFSREPAL